MARVAVWLGFVVVLLLCGTSVAENGGGYLGMHLEAVERPEGSSGVGIAHVERGSGAAAAGLKPDDIIVAIDGVRPSSIPQVTQLIGSRSPGAVLPIEVERAGQRLRFQPVLGTRPDLEEIQRRTVLGHPAPGFSVTPLDGGAPITLASLRGKVVLLDFWATWCRPCEITTPRLNQLRARYTRDDVEVLGITSESLDVVRKAARPIEYAVAVEGGQAQSDFSIYSLPTLVVIDRQGMVRSIHPGAQDLTGIESGIDELIEQR